MPRKYKKRLPKWRRCVICRRAYPSSHGNSRTCGPRCRKAKSRLKLDNMPHPKYKTDAVLEQRRQASNRTP